MLTIQPSSPNKNTPIVLFSLSHKLEYSIEQHPDLKEKYSVSLKLEQLKSELPSQDNKSYSGRYVAPKVQAQYFCASLTNLLDGFTLNQKKLPIDTISTNPWYFQFQDISSLPKLVFFHQSKVIETIQFVLDSNQTKCQNLGSKTVSLSFPFSCTKKSKQGESCWFIEPLNDNQLIAVVRDAICNAECRILNASTLEIEKSWLLGPMCNSHSNVCLTPDKSKILLFDSNQSSIGVFATDSGKKLMTRQCTQKIYSIATIDSIVAVGHENGIALLSLESNLKEYRWINHSSIVLSLAISNDGLKLFTGDTNGILRGFDLSINDTVDDSDSKLQGKNSSNSQTCTNLLFESQVHSYRILFILSVGNFCYSCSTDWTVKKFNILTKKVDMIYSGWVNDVCHICVFCDTYLAGASRDNSIRIFDITTGTHLDQLDGLHSTRVHHVTWFKNALYSASEDETFKRWEFV